MFEKAVEIDKTNPWALFRLGWIYIRNGDKLRGIENLKKSLSYDPDNADVLTKLGEVLMRDNHSYDEAEGYLRKALEIDGNIPDALVSMGRIYEKKGNVDEAVKCYEKALK